MKKTIKKTTVAELIEALSKFPPDAHVEAYEGEAVGVRVDDAETGNEIGFVKT